jgi:hypothetical protein
MVPAAHRWKSPVSGPGRLFWRVVDQLDYWVTLARLRVLDALCGPEPETEADERRTCDQLRSDKEGYR